MKEDAAKKHLVKVRGSFSTGTVLHILADICRDDAEDASRRNEHQLADQCRTVAATLMVVGFGIDAALPR